jgi:hypothetical protein
VVETYADIEDSVCDILDGIPHAYDFYDTADLSSIDFSPYDIIILGMDGGQTDQADMAHLATYINAGAKLIIVGGSSLAAFAQGLNDNFIQIDTANYGWTQVSGTPDMTVVDAGHPLASGLPGTYNFVDNRASYYMARITDVGVRVLAENGDGHPCYVCKPIGQGEVIYFTNSAYQSYWADAGDYAILDTILRNAIEHSCGPVCETTWDVYLGTSPGNMQLVCQDVEDPCCDPGGLSYGTNYFWQVVAKRCCGSETPGPVWRFKTVCLPPPEPIDPDPPAGAVGVPLDPVLTWRSGGAQGCVVFRMPMPTWKVTVITRGPSI